MQKILAVLGVTLLVTACATTATPAGSAIPVAVDRVYLHQQQPDTEFGTLVVTRDTGYAGSFCFIGIYIDGKLAAKLNPRETTKFLVPKGELIVGVGGAGGSGTCGLEKGFRREISVLVNSGDIKRFRVVVRPGDGAAIEPTTM